MRNNIINNGYYLCMPVSSFPILAIVPKQGAIKGIQNLIMIKSGLSFLTSLPTFIQLKGLIELIEP
jgi:hypothetical protein